MKPSQMQHNLQFLQTKELLKLWSPHFKVSTFLAAPMVLFPCESMINGCVERRDAVRRFSESQKFFSSCLSADNLKATSLHRFLRPIPVWTKPLEEKIALSPSRDVWQQNWRQKSNMSFGPASIFTACCTFVLLLWRVQTNLKFSWSTRTHHVSASAGQRWESGRLVGVGRRRFH